MRLKRSTRARRALTTVLFTDIVASTEHAVSIGDRRFADLIGRHHRIVRQLLRTHGGREIDTAGDGFFASFREPDHARACALEIAHAVPALGIQIRAGIHVGEVEQLGKKVGGIAVHVAARILSTAQPEQVVVSSIVRELSRGSQFDFEDLGPHNLKGVPEPVRLYAAHDRQGAAQAAPGAALPPTIPRSHPADAIRIEPDLASLAPLPAPLSDLIGRAVELAQVRNLLSEHRLVTVTGPGGVGKTRLAIEAARRSAALGMNTGFIDLSPIREPEVVPEVIRAVLQLPAPIEGQEAAEMVRDALARTAGLLVIDNLEQILMAGRFIRQLAEATPSMQILVTSRAPLGIHGEYELPIGPLPTPTEVPSSGDAIAGSDALALFLREIRRINPSATFTAEETAAAAEICRRLDGLPLALELVAAQTRILSLATLLTRLTDRLDVAARDLDHPERQRTLRTAIRWSADMLSGSASSLFARLSVFVGGFTLEAAESVAADSSSADAALDELVRHSLVTVHASRDRFGMLETVREFAHYELEKSGSLADAREAACQWLISVVSSVEAAYSSGRSRRLALDRADAERNNVRDAIAWASLAGKNELALRLASGKNFWAVRGGALEGLALLRDLVGRAVTYSPRTLAQGRTVLAGLALNTGELVEARTQFEAALPLWTELGERRHVAVVHNNLGIVLERQDRLTESREHAQQALNILRELNDQIGIAAGVGNLGLLSMRLNDLDSAEDYMHEAFAIAEQLGDELTMSISATNLAEILVKRGDLSVAKPWLRQALDLARKLDDMEGTIVCLDSIAEIANRESNIDLQVRLHAGADRLRRESGFAPYPVRKQEIDRLLASARKTLGEEAFTQAWSAGASLDIGPLVTMAQREMTR